MLVHCYPPAYLGSEESVGGQGFDLTNSRRMRGQGKGEE